MYKCADYMCIAEKSLIISYESDDRWEMHDGAVLLRIAFSYLQPPHWKGLVSRTYNWLDAAHSATTLHRFKRVNKLMIMPCCERSAVHNNRKESIDY